MNSTAVAAPRGSSSDLPAQSPPTARTTLATLVRRELWEHPALWRAPLVIAALLIGTMIIGVSMGGAHIGMDINEWEGGTSAERRAQAFAVSQLAPMFPLYLIMMLVLSFYLLDCLYAERKDRSILFWKSMPVSDGLTVLSKLLVALIVVPLGVLMLAAVCHVLLFLLWQIGVATGHAPAVLTWNTVIWFKVELVMFLCFLLGALWYAPVAAAFLLVSAWARRSPVMWVTLAPLVAMIVEWKLGTHYVASLLNYRTVGIWQVLGFGGGDKLEHHSLKAVLGDFHFAAAFTNLNLWLGVAATALLILATVRVRRYRDDT